MERIISIKSTKLDWKREWMMNEEEINENKEDRMGKGIWDEGHMVDE